MAQYLILRSHRGRYGYMRKRQVVPLPDQYARDLMRQRPALVEPFKPPTAAQAAVAAAAGGALGEGQAGGTSEVLPAAGEAKPSPSRPRARRSRSKTSTTPAVARD